MRRTVTN